MAVSAWQRLAFPALILATGCGNDPGRVMAEFENLDLLRREQMAPAAGSPAAPPPGSLLRMTLEADGRSALMARITERGETATFSTRDPITFTLIGGRLAETRGLSSDLISAEPGPALGGLRGGESYLRRWQVLGPDDAILDIRLHCEIHVSAAGRKRNLEERCAGGEFSIVNQFVMISPQTLLWSRQWIGPRAGYTVLLRPES